MSVRRPSARVRWQRVPAVLAVAGAATLAALGLCGAVSPAPIPAAHDRRGAR